MADAKTSKSIITSETLATTDWRNQWIETDTSANDFATGEGTLLISTVPFLPAGDNFSDVPMYPVGLTQQFSFTEGLIGAMVPELGSARKTNTVGTAMGSGTISRLLIHGNSLASCLLRPSLQFMASTSTLSTLADKILSPSTNTEWIKGLLTSATNLWDAELTEYIDKVVAAGGQNSLLYKIPFGLVEVIRDPKQRVVGINYFEQCGFRGMQGGVSAGQFQMIESMNFEFERVRAVAGFGPFSVSSD